MDKTDKIPLFDNCNISFLKCIFLSLLFTIGCNSDMGNQTKSQILFKGVHVIDAADSLRSNMSVVVIGDRINAVGKASDIDAPNGATVIDGQGKYLIPGLWDAHVHLSYNKALISSMFSLFLANGITSIRDTGGHLDLVMPLKEKSMQQVDTTPRLMVAGPLLDGVPRVYDGDPGRPNLAVGADSPEEARQTVDSLVNAGVDLIKSYEMLTPEAFAAVLDQAQSHGMKVTGHVPLSMDVIDASRQGLNSMEHLRNLEMACSSNHESLLKERLQMLGEGRSEKRGGMLRSSIHEAQRVSAIRSQDEERCSRVLNLLAENNTWQIPTITLLTGSAYRSYTRKEWGDNFRYLPDSVGQSWEKRILESADEPIDPDSKLFAGWAMEMISQLKKSGVKIMAGTDTPISFLTPGFSLHEELALLVRGGLSPLRAIESATFLPAQYFEMEDELGLIKKGMFADLLLLNANPLEDINNTRQIESVIKDGKLYTRADLDDILLRLENKKEN